MGNRYVSAAGGNSSPYENWTDAATSLTTAVAAAAAGETVWVDSAFNEAITGDQTYTLATGVRIISVTKPGTDVPPTTYTAGATIDGTGTSGVDITIAGVGSVHGVTFKAGNSTNVGYVKIATAANNNIICDDCDFVISGTSSSSSVLIGSDLSGRASSVVTRVCTFTWGASTQGVSVYTNYTSVNDDFSAGGTNPSVIFEVIAHTGCVIDVQGGDLSDIATIFETTPANNPIRGTLVGCKMRAAGFTVFAPSGYGYGEVFLYDCDDGDSHYEFGHWNYYGSTTISTSVRCTTNGATYDGTSYHSWVVSSTGQAGPHAPYISPWIDVYHSGTSAITPYLEAVRVGNATAYEDDQVWSEFAYKNTSGSTRYTLVDDRNANFPVVSGGGGTAQTASSLGAGDWEGETGTYAMFKLGPASSITPAEIGHIRARVVVAFASVSDLYVDPKIRGLT